MAAMMTRAHARIHRHARVRRKIIGTAERPRLSVFRSHRHLYAQLINDIAGRTLASASTLEASLRRVGAKKKGPSVATEVGRVLAERASSANIRKVVFDRGGYLFHGRVKALAEGARQAGLEF